MSENLRNNYFVIIRMLVALSLEVYLILTSDLSTGVSYWVLLLCALLIVCSVLNHRGRYKILLLPAEGILTALLIYVGGSGFLLMASVLILDIVTGFSLSLIWYFTPLLLLTKRENRITDFMIILLFIIIYVQNYIVIASYQKQLQENLSSEIKLKRNMNEKESLYQEKLQKNLLETENAILEEKASLSQALHDKLGHSINGSVYQLEACKVVLPKDEKAAEQILQAVINNLRMSMDEIRKILRREKPEKYKLAMIQLQDLCEECRDKGIQADLVTEGDMKRIPEKYIEIILDNAYEAVSNAMKYAKCSKITIEIHQMNKIVRASVTDNGGGCTKLIDGMGISGMRKRMREAGGILDFESEAGFSVKMLFQLQEENNG